MTKFAENTTVSAQSSRAEIERILERYGADQFMYGWQDDKAVIGFRMNARMVRFVLPLPSKTKPEFTHSSRGARTTEAALALWEKAVRQRWRALALVVKAKLEAVESEITTFDDEFLAHIMLPGGSGTVGEWMRPQVEQAYLTGRVPEMLPMLEGPKS